MMTVVPTRPASRLWLRTADGMAVIVLATTLWLTTEAFRSQLVPHDRFAVAPGISSECRGENFGLVHIVTVDLRSPTVQVELGPRVDPVIEKRLVWLPTLARQAGWAIAVSGGDFSTRWGRYALGGQPGQPDQTIISDGRIVQRRPDAAVLWFDEHQTGHLEPLSETSAVWTAGRWALGGHRLCVWNGAPANSADSTDQQRERRTMAGLDQTGCSLTLVTFESATVHEGAAWLAAHGVWRAMELGVAENAGIVVSASASGNSSLAKAGPRRFIPHALGIRSTASTKPVHHP